MLMLDARIVIIPLPYKAETSRPLDLSSFARPLSSRANCLTLALA